MTATAHAPGVLIDLSKLSRRDEVHAYAVARGVGWVEAITELVNRALSDGAGK